MNATLMIIRLGSKNAFSRSGDLEELTKAITEAALRDETIAEAVTRAAVDVDIQRQTALELISMTKSR